jgi:hypothetical protein
MAALAALAANPALAASPPATADQALARQRSSLRSSLGLDCDRGGGDIVVCGRPGPDPNRLPLPVQPEPGARVAGEASLPGDSLALTRQRCTTVGPDQQCSGGLPILGIAIWIVQAAIKAARDED